MKISKKTIDIIKTFGSINSNLLLLAGKEQKTVSIAGNVFATAQFDEEVEQEFGIYNASEFLGALSLFKEPEIEFGEKFAKLSDASGNFSLRYIGASKEVLVYPEKKFVEPKYDIEFTLTQEQMASITKGASIIGAPDLQITSGKNGIVIKCLDRKKTSTSDFEMTISNVEYPENIFNLKIDNLKVFPGNQEVAISAKGITRWKNSDAGVAVYVALEAK